jgi:glycosyltransferase involved in cell wall biosynthesis
MMAPLPDVVYVLPDKLGGVFNFCANLLAHRRPGGLRHRAVVAHNRLSTDVRSGERLPADDQVLVEHELPMENVFAALRRVRNAVAGQGALVAHDWIELAAASAYSLDRTVFQVVHGDFDYYYDLALKHEPDIDAYVTYTDAIYQRLRTLLPHRTGTIFLRRYGVHIGGIRRPGGGPLRLIYSGRLDRAKGVFDLPVIDAALRDAGIDVCWTVQGTGPDGDALRRAWPHPGICWMGRRDLVSVLDGYTSQDVLVMPSRNEGLPVALLEAGAAGVVPVVSDLRSGVPEVVRQGTTGFLAQPGDIRAFVDGIAALARDRGRLEAMSAAMRDLVAREWDIATNAAGYEALFERWPELRRTRRAAPRRAYGSRLDQRWLPNALVRSIRRARGPYTSTKPAV